MPECDTAVPRWLNAATHTSRRDSRVAHRIAVLSGIFVVAITGFLPVEVARAADLKPPAVVKLPEPPTEVVMSDGGVLAMLTEKGDSVLIYDRAPAGATAPAAKKVRVGPQPRAVTYKRSGERHLF